MFSKRVLIPAFQISIALAISFLALCLSTAFAQNKVSHLDKILDKKWGLAHYVEIYSAVSDTLFSVRDCQNEYLQLYSNKRYEFSAYDRKEQGTWKKESDSLFVLYSDKGKLMRRYEIREVSRDSMTILDLTQRNAYLEIYKVCQPNDNEFFDSRDMRRESKGYDFLVGLQYFKSPVLELGIAKTYWNWKKTLFALALSAEIAPFNSSFKEKYEYRTVSTGVDTVQIAPWNNYYGLALTAWTQSWASFGLSATVHTDGKKTHPGAKVLLGFSPKKVFEGAGKRLNIGWSYQFFFADSGPGEVNLIQNINRHSFNIRYLIPLRSEEKQVRKIRNYEN